MKGYQFKFGLLHGHFCKMCHGEEIPGNPVHETKCHKAPLSEVQHFIQGAGLYVRCTVDQRQGAI
jgi:hypothetical protein